jgi:SAM-dependent methyltransferase
MQPTTEVQRAREANRPPFEVRTAEALIAKCETELANYTGYLAFHRERYEYLWRLCQRLVPQREARVIDVGRSPFSARLASHYAEVYTLGLPVRDKEFGAVTVGSSDSLRGHIEFDLNDAQHPGRWPALPAADLVCFAETIEHLRTAPELVLLFLRTALKKSGYLVCQTPNAAALHKRLKSLWGLNPYERLRPAADNPGHFREYTKKELYELGRAAGLRVCFHEYADYFGLEGGWLKRAAEVGSRVPRALYPPFRRGQTIVYNVDEHTR